MCNTIKEWIMESYYERNKETIKQQSKARYEANKEKCLAQNKAWRAANPEKFKESQDKWLSKNPMYVYYGNARRRAREAGVPFTIHYTDIKIPEHCEISGVRLDKEDRELAPSLDRVKPELGYVPGNIAVISVRMNRIKSDGTAAEHRKIADYIDRRS
jgi:hypothetical protein